MILVIYNSGSTKHVSRVIRLVFNLRLTHYIFVSTKSFFFFFFFFVAIPHSDFSLLATFPTGYRRCGEKLAQRKVVATLLSMLCYKAASIFTVILSQIFISLSVIFDTF
eukprot:TRINITY_DN4518_c0_g2_i1.p1 TRINITY_DN4518_c0_g2~~TRINITY_DN4518_c0_g2_i1.p1  ORF type:complete len:109 (+),score=10.38 TRINITY_DN4518_c0_g2_i1:123-449(+)